MIDWLSRTEMILESEALKKLHSSNVLVVGLGGVGAYAAEMICRAGVGKMTIVDGDTIQPSNRNRQFRHLRALKDWLKQMFLAAELKDINPDLNLR